MRTLRPWPLVAAVLLAFPLACEVSTGGSKPPGGSGAGTGPSGDPQTPPASTDPRVVDIDAGRSHTCALRANGQVLCWGTNARGQLGDGGFKPRNRPTRVGALADAEKLALGAEHSCVLRRGGAVACWGSNEHGQLGNGRGGAGRKASTPVDVRDLEKAVDLVSGDNHVCARLESGATKCWGDNRKHQLGNRGRPMWPSPVLVRGLVDAQGLAAGEAHTCARRKQGGPICWGDGDRGQLGDGRTGHARDRPGPVVELPAARGLFAGGAQTCAIHQGAARCWGARKSGDQPRPRALQGPSDPEQVALGREHGCVRTSSGRVACWGANRDGRLGDGTTSDHEHATVIRGLTDIVDVAVGDRHSCALDKRGTVRCWGDGRDGALGPDVVASARPDGVRRAFGIDDAIDLGAGANFACAATRAGEVRCWGENAEGQLGDGSTKDRGTPKPVDGIDGARAVGVGTHHACAALDSGAVRCWGQGDGGKLGIPAKGARPRPVAVPRVTDAVDVAAGTNHSCALRRNGAVVCWGSDEFGQLGDGNAAGKVVGVGEAVELAAGLDHTCARTRGGSVRCWGRNQFGQLGDGSGAAQLKTPATVSRSVVKVSDALGLHTGDTHTCAALRTGKAVCWGHNDLAQLGSGTLSSVWTTRVPVRDVQGATSIGGGANHTCVGRGNQTSCWGAGKAGQLGPSNTDAATARRGPAVDAAQIAGGDDFTCARSRDGSVWCWGNEADGRLGDDDKPWSASPVKLPIP